MQASLDQRTHVLSLARDAHGTMSVDELKRLKDLERENSQLKRLVSDQALDILMLKEVAKGKY